MFFFLYSNKAATLRKVKAKENSIKNGKSSNIFMASVSLKSVNDTFFKPKNVKPKKIALDLVYK